MKSRNIVKVVSADGTVSWVLIDLDATCAIGSAAGQKVISHCQMKHYRSFLFVAVALTVALALQVTSSAYFPPEMARYKQKGATWQAPVATVQFEMFYFGLLVYQLCTPDAELVWKTNQADNMINWAEDSLCLAYNFEEMKLDICNRIMSSGKEWSAAADLCLWCLQPCTDRRPGSMDDVLQHPFFDADPAYHCTPAWQLHYPEVSRLRFLSSTDDTLASAMARWAVELHKAPFLIALLDRVCGGSPRNTEVRSVV